MTTQVLRGKIEPLALIDVLAYLGRSRASGVLKVVREDVEKSVIIHNGTIIFARSNQMQDRLGDFLLARNMITQDQYEQGTELIYEKGFRHGRALVEIGAITPRVLWSTLQEQVKSIASSIIPWESGEFQFVKKEIKRKESITLKWPILDMVQDVIRSLDNVVLFKSRFSNPNEVLRLNEDVDTQDIKLEPYEEYILDFIDGEMTIKSICEISDYGELESLRVLYLLRSLGWISSVPMVSPSRVHPMVANFNKIYVYLHGYLTERVGKVGSNLLRKYFEETRRQHLLIFDGVSLMNDGRLNPGEVQLNLDKLSMEDDESLMALDDALNEFLNVCMLAVTKLLGAEHEAAVVQKIGEFG
jgi:hypothetical protein